ncbi:MAG TPA: OpgC domain-containing protein [Candidatus Acidoferrales bacterium]|nr:OpgC domain-containing protein [Candidatus Acidoferrales bacterium]
MQQRIEELDALRGLMLVWITCTHLPTILSTYVNQPLGFFAASEGSFLFPLCLQAAFISGSPNATATARCGGS